MASLSFIMDVTDDHTTTAGRRPLPSFNKRDRSPDDKPPSTSAVSVQVPAQGRSQTYETTPAPAGPPGPPAPPPGPPPPLSTPPKPVEKGSSSQGSSSTTSPGPAPIEQDINHPAASAGQTTRHGASPKKPKPVPVVVVGPLETIPRQEGPSKSTPRQPRAGEAASASTTTTASSPSSPSSAPNPVPVATQGSSTTTTASTAVAAAAAAAPLAPSSAAATAKTGTTTSKPSLRSSTTVNDPMDRSRYGSVSSASTVSNAGLQRPAPPSNLSPTPYTPKYTPKTGRVSKAKKGLPVHVCDICRPIKVRPSV